MSQKLTFSKIQIGFTFLVLAHLGSCRKRAVEWVCVCIRSSNCCMEQNNGVLSCGAAAVVDILDIKWESLVSADKPRLMPPGSALHRFATHRILHDIGVSAAFAGDALLQKLKSVCQQQMDSEASSLAAAPAPGNSPAEWFWSSCVPHCYARVCVCVCMRACVRACVRVCLPGQPR